MMPRHLSWCVAFWMLSAPSLAYAEPDRPVFVIPGILGSKLCERGTDNIVWGDRLSLFRFTRLALQEEYDPEKLPHASCGTIDSIQMIGPWRSHQYDDLMRTLANLGYKNGQNLFVFDYDWRLGNRVTARKLRDFITLHAPSGSIDLIAHSMGGIVARLYIQELGGGTRVNRLLTLGTPHLGSANVFKILDEGWSWYENLMAHGVSGIRATALTFPSMLELLPSYPKCCGWQQASGSALDYFDPFDPNVWRRFSWLPPESLAGARGARFNRDLAEAKSVHVTLAQKLPASVRHVNIATSLIPTAWRVVAQRGDGKIVDLLRWPGDGTVIEFSASNGASSEARPSSTEHARIFADTAAEQVIRWVLKEDVIPTAGVLKDFQASLRTADGSTQRITGISYETRPAVLRGGESGVFVVQVSGEANLADADLSNVTATLDGSSALRAGGRRDRREPDSSVVVTLELPFSSPAEEGFHSISLSVPGISDLQDYFIVVGPGQSRQ